jgi:urease accessory protein
MEALLMSRKTLVALLVLLPTFASAHTGAGTAFGFSDGFWHPLEGLDHLLAMFAVGLLAAQLGGNAVWLVPGMFIALMIARALAGKGLAEVVRFVEETGGLS